ncbi:hypothetical protein [Pseudoxanthomonas sp.]|jgi:Predicted hydrolase (metallo-beta-lactamase superfamily)|uniref:hypothetical protein n=1 Tax=Pseudoxanthomonas sp. TaxID=1871049 RepID=UPI002FE39C3C
MGIVHSRIQHGVGQGSFHSASVETSPGAAGPRYRFDYVYDCGAMAGPNPSKALEKAINRLGLEQRKGSSGPGVLDMLVLSHFDSDHLNGAQLLCSKFTVRRIFVPYLRPDMLSLVVASLAERITDSHIRALHQLAHGEGTLWDTPVTMVRSGDDTPPRREIYEPDEPGEPRHPDDESQIPPLADLVLGSTGQRPATEMADVDTVLTEFGSISHIWKFKFWNREADQGLLDEIKRKLDACGFPRADLQDPAGAAAAAKWLRSGVNRDNTVAAYRKAIASYKPAWGHEATQKGIANLLSLAMYSGPAFYASKPLYRSRYHITNIYAHDWWPYETRALTGWLGTGDAPLGEPEVWDDFQAHYLVELPNVSTYVVPHHGAAPSGGPRYYNAKLNHTAGVASVISYGSKNTYGHPRFTVLTHIQATHGHIVEVTEECRNGFQEILLLNTAHQMAT